MTPDHASWTEALSSHQRAGVTLEESEQKYRAVLEFASEAIVIVEGAGRIVLVNRKAEEIFGYKREEMLGNGVEMLIPERLQQAHAEHRRTYFFHPQARPLGGTVLELVARRKDGAEFPIDIGLSLIELGGQPFVVSFITDITGRKKVEAAIREQSALAEALVDTAAAISSTLHFDEVLERILENLGRVVPHDSANIMLLDSRAEILRIAKCRGYRERGLQQWVLGLKFNLSEFPNFRRMTESGQPYLIPDTRTHPGWVEFPETKWIRSNIGAPIRVKGQTIGILHVDSETPDFFNTTHALRLQAFADQAAVAIENARLFEELQKELGERQQAESVLKRSQQKYASLVSSIEGVVWERDVGTSRFTFVSTQAERLLGYPSSQWVSEPDFWGEHVHPDDREWAIQFCQKATRSLQPHQFEYRMLAADGRVVSVRDLVTVIAEGNQAVTLRGILLDITERKQAEEALRASEQRYRGLAESAHEFIFIINRNREVEYVNQYGAKFLNSRPEDIVGRQIQELFPAGIARRQMLDLEKVFQTGKAMTLEAELRFSQQKFWLQTELIPLTQENNEVMSVMGISRDLTERKRAEEALRESEQRYRLLFESNPNPMWVYAIDSLTFLAVNDAAIEHYGYSKEEFLSMTIRDIWPLEEIPALLDTVTMLYPHTNRSGCWHHRRKDGSMIDVEVMSHGLMFLGYQARLSLIMDITERNRAEEARRKSEMQFRLVWENSADGMRLTDEQGTVLMTNEAFCRMVGKTKEEIEGKPLSVIYAKERQAHILERHEERFRTRTVKRHFERDLTLWDGRKVWFEVSNSFFEQEGQVPLLLAIFRDITSRKQAEEMLRQTEEQLRQAQKMEAVGRLAGGVAHDFNNLLTAINGYSDLVLSRLSVADPLRKDILEIKRAGDRATALTSQLLAFGRKQVLQPRVLSLNAVLTDMHTMLRRLIGEDIEMITQLEPQLGLVKADPGQIEQVILNLVVNARDAMPQGGKLTLTTLNLPGIDAWVPPPARLKKGRYVVLSVTDTGCGMDADILSHIFEPFFTTKGIGKGTGLGLSTVYGIVDQSGGDIEVSSKPRLGSTFRMCLPCVEEGVEASRPQGATGDQSYGLETILLVEDEEMIRTLGVEILQMRGYRVLDAANGDQAMKVSQEHSGPIHLLLTDVVMPKVSGRELAKKLVGLRPQMKVLFMSGYTDDAIVHHGVLEAEMAFIQKPFTPDALTRKVRRVLERSV